MAVSAKDREKTIFVKQLSKHMYTTCASSPVVHACDTPTANAAAVAAAATGPKGGV